MSAPTATRPAAAPHTSSTRRRGRLRPTTLRRRRKSRLAWPSRSCRMRHSRLRNAARSMRERCSWAVNSPRRRIASGDAGSAPSSSLLESSWARSTGTRQAVAVLRISNVHALVSSAGAMIQDSAERVEVGIHGFAQRVAAIARAPLIVNIARGVLAAVVEAASYGQVGVHQGVPLFRFRRRSLNAACVAAALRAVSLKFGLKVPLDISPGWGRVVFAVPPQNARPPRPSGAAMTDGLVEATDTLDSGSCARICPRPWGRNIHEPKCRGAVKSGFASSSSVTL